VKVTRDTISLTIPKDDGFEHVAQLVLAGVAARLSLTYETLDDLEVALESLLERAGVRGTVTVELRIEGEEVHAAIGPFTDGKLAELEGAAPDALGLQRVLDTVVDRFDVAERHDGQWVELVKSVRFKEPA
jgi:hypothetical protein